MALSISLALVSQKKLHHPLLTILLLGMNKTSICLCPTEIFLIHFICMCTLAEKIVMNQCFLVRGNNFKSSHPFSSLVFALMRIEPFLPHVLPTSSLRGAYILLRRWFGHAVINALTLVPGGRIQTAEGHAQQDAEFPAGREARGGAEGASGVSPQRPPNAPRGRGRAAAPGTEL